MRNFIRLLAFAIALLPGLASAQVPPQPMYLPQPLPPLSVIGNASGAAGPAVAVPFSQINGNGANWPSQLANRFWAGPTSGTPAQPTFRSLVGADLPTIGNSNLAQMPANTVKCNPTGSTAVAQDCASPVINFGKYLSTQLMPIRFDIAKNCTVDPTGTNDMGACINSTISDAVAALTISGGLATAGAGAYVYVPCGTYKISTAVVYKSWVQVRGGGRGCTVFNPTVNNAFTTDPTHQTIFSGMSDASIRCAAGCSTSWTGLQLYSIEASNFSVLEITGFSAGHGISIAPSNASVTVQYASGFFGTGGNAIFNNFKDIALQNVGSGITYSGHWNGTSCDILVTDNVFDKIVMTQVQFGVGVVLCADSNHFSAVQYYGITGGTCITIGNDGVAADHGSYQLYFDGLCSSYFGATAGTLIFIVSNGNSWGHHIHIQTDDIFSLSGGVGAYGACITKANSTQIIFADLELPGICNPNIPADGAVNSFGGTSAAILGGDSMYFQGGTAGSRAAPAFSFYGDNTNGIYSVGTGVAGFSKDLRVDGHLRGGAASTPTLSSCGTSPSFAGTASDTAGRVTVGSGPPTTCQLSFGTAYNTAPVCVITPVGATQQVYISAQATTGIIWNWGTATVGQQFNYTCLALPGG